MSVAIGEVIKTLLEAIFLVFLVMLVFLGTFRATLIPTMAVPVVVLGTFAVLWLFGFSINILTMFAMVLAIGLLVDDAIVVVENVERIMKEEQVPPREATAKSMEQLTSALIGIGLVLSAVFGPMVFFGGSTGVIYRQFSITLAAAMLLSVVVALILTPDLCASFLKPSVKDDEAKSSLPLHTSSFRVLFERFFVHAKNIYVKFVGHVLPRKLRYCLIYLVCVGATGLLFVRMPTAYLPEEDQGILLAQVMMPAGTNLEQTQQVLEVVRHYFLEQEKEAVESCLTVAGIGVSGRAQSNGIAFIKLRN